MMELPIGDQTCGGCGFHFATTEQCARHWYLKRCRNYTEDMVVEDIVDKKRHDSKVWYKVRWQGWSSDWDEWLPLQELQNCRTMIQNYERNNRRNQ